jgi:hypothetical protein
LRDVAALCVDLYVPEGMAGMGLTLLLQAKDSHEPAPVMLRPGWNPVVIKLNDGWVPPEERAAVKDLQWVLTAAGNKTAGWVVFDNFRAETLPRRPAVRDLRDGWEGGLLWGVWDQSVAQERAMGPRSGKPVGLK